MYKMISHIPTLQLVFIFTLKYNYLLISTISTCKIIKFTLTLLWTNLFGLFYYDQSISLFHCYWKYWEDHTTLVANPLVVTIQNEELV